MLRALARWAVPMLLLCAAFWAANRALANMWAGGGPPVADPEVYRRRGLIAAVLSVFFGVTGLIVALRAFRFRGR